MLLQSVVFWCSGAWQEERKFNWHSTMATTTFDDGSFDEKRYSLGFYLKRVEEEEEQIKKKKKKGKVRVGFFLHFACLIFFSFKKKKKEMVWIFLSRLFFSPLFSLGQIWLFGLFPSLFFFRLIRFGFFI